MSLHSESPGHWAILYMRMEPGPAEHLNLADRPAATVVYRPGGIVPRDSLRTRLRQLLAESAGRATENARGEELLRQFADETRWRRPERKRSVRLRPPGPSGASAG